MAGTPSDRTSLHSAGRSAAAVGAPPSDSPPRGSVLRRLGLYGLDAIEPVILAALATEEPLLLVGPHGTAKSLLLTRIAAALLLECRHYNASLLNFDDLVGFPLPGPGGTLEYVRTPGAIWEAGAVIFDEISRCRPDIQNKLFPIVHERRAQGLLIDTLRYRWAAMNPPAADDEEHGYTGSEPLDPALADRFAFVVSMPAWSDLGEQDQLAVIRAESADVDPAAGAVLGSVVSAIRAAIPVIQQAMRDSIGQYARAAVQLLGQAAIALSPRRAGMLARAVIAVHAARLSAGPAAALRDSAYVALQASLPQRAQGIAIAERKLLAVHREAWRLAAADGDDALRAVLLTADPLERLRLAVAASTLSKTEVSSIVADALPELAPGAREAAVVHLFESGAVGQLHAAVADQAGQLYATVLEPATFSEAVHNTSPRFATWKRLESLLARLDPGQPGDHMCANLLAAAFARKELAHPDDVDRALAAWLAARVRLSGATR